MSRSFRDDPGPATRLAEGFFRAGTAVHRGLYDRGWIQPLDVGRPVISVGNLTAGGTGETPCVIWLAAELNRMGRRPVVLSRGYGRRRRRIVRIDGTAPPPSLDDAGDEPLEMAASLPGVPILVGRDRRLTGLMAVRDYDAGCIVLDDGFQHRPLARQFDLVLLDAERPFGNGHLLPAGPLREPPGSLRRASAVLLTRAERAGDPAASRRRVESIAPGVPVGLADHVRTGLEPLVPNAPGERPAGGAVLATAGTGDPASVLETITEAGFQIGEPILFDDHARYGPEDVERVNRQAGGRPVVTTAKDAVRWSALRAPERFLNWWVVRVAFRPRAAEELLRGIEDCL